MPTQDSPLTPAERRVIDSATRLVAGCAPGFDTALLDAIRDVLLEAIELDGLAITVEDEGGTFRLLWRSSVGEPPGSPIAVGERQEHVPQYEGFANPPSQTRPRVVEDARASADALARAAAKMGILSYVDAPILLFEEAVGWLVVAHRVPGAPSQRSMPLLVELARVLAPAVVRGEDGRAAARHGRRSSTTLPTGCSRSTRPARSSRRTLRALRLLGRPRSRSSESRCARSWTSATFAKLLLVLRAGPPRSVRRSRSSSSGTAIDVSVPGACRR